MTSIQSIFLGSLLLLQAMAPAMDLSFEMQKLPALFEHFEEHRLHDGTSFTSFLYYHYGISKEAESHHHDDEHDGKLPFHGQHLSGSGVVFITPFYAQVALGELPFSIQSQSSIYSFSISTEHLSSPFQPPKA